MHNIALFSDWRPQGRIVQADWICCRGENGAPAGDWREQVRELRRFDSDAAHHTVMTDRDVIVHISQLINGGAMS
ncbi:hypothetical protein GGER_21650 [Serratia rubidaea]